jgi:outer membrane immunogenic protein
VSGYTYNWTGVYVGGNVGYSWASLEPVISGPGFLGNGAGTLRGANGGGQFGYNWQVSLIVYSIEGDIEAANLRGSTLFAGISETDNVRWVGTLRGRVGYATPVNNLMLYATGGASAAQVGTTLIGGVNGTISGTRTGWTAGGGLEYGLNVNWSLKGEYLHLDFLDTGGAVGKFTAGSQLREDIFRLGFNYKLGGL